MATAMCFSELEVPPKSAGIDSLHDAPTTVIMKSLLPNGDIVTGSPECLKSMSIPEIFRIRNRPLLQARQYLSE